MKNQVVNESGDYTSKSDDPIVESEKIAVSEVLNLNEGGMKKIGHADNESQ